MSRSAAQLNIRSDAAKRRVSELVRETGKTATQVVEEALQAYRPEPPAPEAVPEGFTRKGRLLVRRARPGETSQSLQWHLDAIAEAREERDDLVMSRPHN